MKQLLACIFLCIGSTLAAQTTRPIQEAMVNYDYETALTLIAKEKQATPTLLLQKGRAQKGLSMNAEALATFRQLIAEDAQNPLAYLETAECCKLLAKYKEALNYYNEALMLNPKNKYVRLQYIALLCQQGYYEEAFGESSVMAEADSSAAVLHLQAQSLEGLNDVWSAIGCYHVIQDKYPDDYLAAAKLGSLYSSVGEYKYAIEATEVYRQIDSTNIVVNRQNAVSYCLNKDYPTAIERYQYLQSQGDSTLLTNYYFGICYYATEKYYEAHDLLLLVSAKSPEDPNLLYYLGRACSKTSWKKEGIEYLKRAIELTIPSDSTMTRLYKGLADCYNLGRQPKEQIEAMKKQYTYNSNNHKLLYDIAYIYQYDLKDKKSAEHHLEAFLKTKPKDAKEATGTLNERGEVDVDFTRYYQAAQNWLNDLRNDQKKEDFFRVGAPIP